MVECLVWDQDAAGSSPVTSTIKTGNAMVLPVLILNKQRGVAQFGRALRSGRRGRRFDSCHLDH